MRRIVVCGGVLVVLALAPGGAAAATGVSPPEVCDNFAGPPVHKAACAPFVPHRADGKLAEWRGTPPHIPRRPTTSFGEVIYTAWLYHHHPAPPHRAPRPTPVRAPPPPPRGRH